MENKKIGLSELSKFSSHQLVNLYNKNVDPEIMTAGQGQFFWHLVAELRKRGIDCSKIANGNNIYYGPSFYCFLHRRKIYLQRDFSPSAWIRLNLKDGRKWEFNVKTVYVDTPYVSVSSFTGIDPILLIIRHDHIQTHIDATGVPHYLIGGFDHRGNFTSMSVLNSTDQGRYALLSQARTALVIREGWELLNWDFFELWEKGMDPVSWKLEEGDSSEM